MTTRANAYVRKRDPFCTLHRVQTRAITLKISLEARKKQERKKKKKLEIK